MQQPLVTCLRKKGGKYPSLATSIGEFICPLLAKTMAKFIQGCRTQVGTGGGGDKRNKNDTNIYFSVTFYIAKNATLFMVI